jgi:hypothetical protein
VWSSEFGEIFVSVQFPQGESPDPLWVEELEKALRGAGFEVGTDPRPRAAQESKSITTLESKLRALREADDPTAGDPLLALKDALVKAEAVLGPAVKAVDTGSLNRGVTAPWGQSRYNEIAKSGLNVLAELRALREKINTSTRKG